MDPLEENIYKVFKVVFFYYLLVKSSSVSVGVGQNDDNIQRQSKAMH